jgi:hypothetical protein
VSTDVAQLLEKALLLPSESQTELVEALLERAEPSQEFLEQQVGKIVRRMRNVRERSSTVVSAADAHDRVFVLVRPIKKMRGFLRGMDSQIEREGDCL